MLAPIVGKCCGLFFRGHGVSPGMIVAMRKCSRCLVGLEGADTGALTVLTLTPALFMFVHITGISQSSARLAKLDSLPALTLLIDRNIVLRSAYR